MIMANLNKYKGTDERISKTLIKYIEPSAQRNPKKKSCFEILFKIIWRRFMRFKCLCPYLKFGFIFQVFQIWIFLTP